MKNYRILIFVLIIAAALALLAGTPPIKPTNQTNPIVIYGDTRTNHNDHRAVVRAIEQVHPQAVFHTGDLVGDGRVEADWDTFFTITGHLLKTTAFYPTLGNHEHDSPLYYKHFNLPRSEQWYSVNIDSIKFIVLNSCTKTDRKSEQYKWLQKELKDAGAETKFTVAVFHHPPYSSGPHEEDEKHLRESWGFLFRKYGVDAVFNGHDHDYERSKVGDIYYIVAGAGGAPLYSKSRDNPYSQVFLKEISFCRLDRSGDTLKIETLDTLLNRIDHVEIE